MDIVDKDEDLMPLALNSIKKLEKLTSINKKISNETINNIRNDVNHEITTISKQKKIHEKSLTGRLFFCTYELSTLSSADISKIKSESKSKSKKTNSNCKPKL